MITAMLLLILLSVAGTPAPVESRLQALLKPAPADPAREARLAARVADDTRLFRSEHFALVHTSRRSTARALAARLERVYRANLGFMERVGLPAEPLSHKLPVLLFGTLQEYRAEQAALGIDDPEMLGFFNPACGCAVFFDLERYPLVATLRRELRAIGATDGARRRAARRQLNENTDRLYDQVVQHEAAHLVQATVGPLQHGAPVPAWLAEGLAQLFEAVPAQGAVDVLPLNRRRLAELGELADDPAALHAGLQRITAAVPEWRGGADYALAWVLVDYLYRRQPRQLGAYLRWLRDREQVDDWAAGAARFFGPLDQRLVSALRATLREQVTAAAREK